MTNNDILRRLRYTFDFNDAKMQSIFASADLTVSQETIHHWLRKDEDPSFQNLPDQKLAIFLNGLINDKRGKKEGEQPEPEKKMNNNIVLRKLKIALNLQSEEVIDVFKLAGFSISKPELSAFFRKQDHKHYRDCKDQILRNFLNGIQVKYRNNDAPKSSAVWPENP